MIPFRPIRLTDRARIEQYTMPRDLYNCDLSFANMYCWQGVYQSCWAEVEGFLVIRFRIDGGEKTGYMQPIGEGDRQKVIEWLADDAAERGEPLRLLGLDNEFQTWLQRTFSERFAFDENRAQHDYIYLRDDLSRLKGKNYQPKRNHINRFINSYPDYRYAPLTEGQIAECIALEQEWCRHRNGCSEGGLNEERVAMQCAFNHFEQLGLQGGCIYVGDRLVAFTYGSALNNHTFDIHVEKADTRYEGAFTIINRLFASSLDDRFTHINREEDLGLEGLRKAKLSYYPHFLQPKYQALELDRKGRACRRLWQCCFPDDERQFVDRFLVRHYHTERMLTCEEEGAIVAMLHTIPFTTTYGPMRYIYGVATDPHYQGRGHATRLLNEAIGQARRAGDAALVLIPGNDSLRDFYSRFGFTGRIPVTFSTGDDFDFGTGDKEHDQAMILPLDALNALPDTLRMELP